eukprot:g20805.t1
MTETARHWQAGSCDHEEPEADCNSDTHDREHDLKPRQDVHQEEMCAFIHAPGWGAGEAEPPESSFGTATTTEDAAGATGTSSSTRCSRPEPEACADSADEASTADTLLRPTGAKLSYLDACMKAPRASAAESSPNIAAARTAENVPEASNATGSNPTAGDGPEGKPPLSGKVNAANAKVLVMIVERRGEIDKCPYVHDPAAKGAGEAGLRTPSSGSAVATPTTSAKAVPGSSLTAPTPAIPATAAAPTTAAPTTAAPTTAGKTTFVPTTTGPHIGGSSSGAMNATLGLRLPHPGGATAAGPDRASTSQAPSSHGRTPVIADRAVGQQGPYPPRATTAGTRYPLGSQPPPPAGAMPNGDVFASGMQTPLHRDGVPTGHGLHAPPPGISMTTDTGFYAVTGYYAVGLQPGTHGSTTTADTGHAAGLPVPPTSSARDVGVGYRSGLQPPHPAGAGYSTSIQTPSHRGAVPTCQGLFPPPASSPITPGTGNSAVGPQPHVPGSATTTCTSHAAGLTASSAHGAMDDGATGDAAGRRVTSLAGAVNTSAGYVAEERSASRGGAMTIEPGPQDRSRGCQMTVDDGLVEGLQGCSSPSARITGSGHAGSIASRETPGTRMGVCSSVPCSPSDPRSNDGSTSQRRRTVNVATFVAAVGVLGGIAAVVARRSGNGRFAGRDTLARSGRG